MVGACQQVAATGLSCSRILLQAHMDATGRTTRACGRAAAARPRGPAGCPTGGGGRAGWGGRAWGTYLQGLQSLLARPPSRAGSHRRYAMRYACSICLRGEPPAVRCTILALFGSLLFHPKNTHPLTTHMTRDHDAIATHDHPPPMALLPETRVPFDWGFQRL